MTFTHAQFCLASTVTPRHRKFLAISTYHFTGATWSDRKPDCRGFRFLYSFRYFHYWLLQRHFHRQDYFSVFRPDILQPSTLHTPISHDFDATARTYASFTLYTGIFRKFSFRGIADFAPLVASYHSRACFSLIFQMRGVRFLFDFDYIDIILLLRGELD